LNPTQYPIIDVIGSYLLCPSFLIIWSSWFKMHICLFFFMK
jgi:hypothetical protein